MTQITQNPFPSLPPRLIGLEEIAENLWWSWHSAARMLFKSLPRLRALVKHLDNVSSDEMVDLNIPTGIPLVYELDEGLRPIKNYYLEDLGEVKKAMEKVAQQAKAR